LSASSTRQRASAATSCGKMHCLLWDPPREASMRPLVNMPNVVASGE
jgi:hypothetical protein